MRAALSVALAKGLERPAIILLSILILALGIRLVFFVGLAEVDDYNYARYTHAITSGEFNLWELGRVTGILQRFRFSILLPVAVSFATWGVSDLTAVLWPLLCSLGSIVLVFCLGKQFYGESEGLLAALLYCFFPLDIVYATRLLPEAILPLFTGLSVLFFVKGDTSPDKNRAYLYFILAGVALGVAYFVRIFAVLILLFFVTYVVYQRKMRREYLLPMAILLLFILPEVSVYYLKTGDFSYRFQELQRINNLVTIQWGMVTPAGYYSQQLFTNDLLKRFYYAVFLAAAYALFSKRTADRIALLWMISLLIFLEYAPIYKEARFLSIITMPALLVLSDCLCSLANESFCKLLALGVSCVFLVLLVNETLVSSLKQFSSWATTPSLSLLVLALGLISENQRVKKVALGVFVLLFGMACFYPSAAKAQQFQSWERPYKETFDFLPDLPQRALYCGDVHTAIRLDFFHRYEQRCELLGDDEDLSAIETAYLIIDLRKEKAQALIHELPQSWRVLQRVYAGANVPQFAIYGVVSRQDAEREVNSLEQGTLEVARNATQYMILGGDYMVLERWEDATSAYIQALARRPHDPQVQSDLIAASVEYVESNWQEVENRDNLLVNPSFEQGTTGWGMHRSSGEDAVFEVREGAFPLGARGAFVEGLTEKYHGGWYQQLQIAQHAVYLFSCRVKTQSERELQGQLLYWESYADGQANGHWSEEFLGSMDWAYKWMVFVAPESDNSLVAFYPVLVTGQGKVWVDDVRLIELQDSILRGSK